MSLLPGARLGRYEILKPLGEGGMGEVYRARDTRLDREVAIKILPESVARDADRLARFDREAKSVAALSHPNILALHDAGTEDGVAFAVMELLEGETLRDRLRPKRGAERAEVERMGVGPHSQLNEEDPVPLRKAIDIAIQIARGLAAAHARGLVHRDLKPENIFLVADGQVKILDFGLAKPADSGSGAGATQTAMTDPGTVLGTVGYMAPEQVRGQVVDGRTDLFALGAVLYEMLTGRRAFQRDTSAETMTAILREEPPDIPPPLLNQAPALDRIVRHCLEKNPAERFQSGRDVAFALEALSGSSSGHTSTSTIGPAPARHGKLGRGRLVWALGGIAAAVVIVLAGWLGGYIHVGAPVTGGGLADIRYQRVTFDEGFVFAARFARDGRTIVYSADWDNQPRDIFVTSTDNSAARALGFHGADLLSLSADGAMAILVNGTIPGGNPYYRSGTVARASLTGGAPKLGQDSVSFADFAPNGDLAVLRWGSQTAFKPRIEWPEGHPIVTASESRFGSPMPNPRVSPAGTHVAFFLCDDATCTVKIATKAGDEIATSQTFSDWWGLAWSPDSHEVWFAAAETGRQCSLYALDLKGQERLITRVPGSLTVHDISTDGRLLASVDEVTGRLEIADMSPAAPRDLSWKEGGFAEDLSADGVVLFDQRGDSGGAKGSVYVRRAGEPEPVRVADGRALAISNNGSTALVASRFRPIQLSIVPTAAGLTQPIDVGAIDAVGGAGWLSDGRLLLEISPKPGAVVAVMMRAPSGGPLTPLLPNGVRLSGPRAIAPDEKHLVGVDATGTHVLCTIPLTGLGACAAVPGMTAEDRVGGWAADNRGVFVYRPYPVPVRIERVDLASGRRELAKILQPATAAVSGIVQVIVAPNGAMVYSYARDRSALFVIGGLRQGG